MIQKTDLNPKTTAHQKNRKKAKPANMPKKVLVLGSGALQIGQGGEFDYSGSQALKAFREEGVQTVLINPNIATIQTDEGLADATYFLPVQPHFVEEILKKEKCDAIALSFGGQTALNCGLALEQSGVLGRLGVRVLGTPVSAIRDTEDRYLFVKRLSEIGVKTARSRAVTNVLEAVEAARNIGFPVMMRSGFSLGGKGSSIVYDEEECRSVAEVAFANVPQILVEECLKGWKELEYEVVRDSQDNCITVCNMENIDPMGIHTGESIVIAPSQTLDDYEYQMLRDIAIKSIRHLGIVGECNIQYALDPFSREYRVIEVNARLSRSSALASKATGYPLAYVAAKIALGYTLSEIPNSVTKVTTAFFEPALDYCVVKMPRWDLEKFEGSDTTIGSEMKSVGEVMAIGRTFPETLQKALRMIEKGPWGLDPHAYTFADLKKELAHPTPRRMFALALAFYQGMGVDEVYDLTKIDRYFLHEIQRIVSAQQGLEKFKGKGVNSLDEDALWNLKLLGFADRMIGKIMGVEESDVRARRWRLGVRPSLTQIDTMAAEYPAETNFLYLTYSRFSSDIEPANKNTLFVLGSGCYRIGSSVEFDWCAVSAVTAAREMGYDVILLNCNPETVSTDYDICERLVFDEISQETVLEIWDFEKPAGVLVSMGGQTPNNLALGLAKAGVKIVGTKAESIDRAENRRKFSDLLDELKISQPKWAEARGLRNIEETVQRLGGYPVLVRPSYVLSGAAMKVAWSDKELEDFLAQAIDVAKDQPVVVTKFEVDSREIEFDGVAKNGKILLSALSEHVESAGVHSGDATLVIPPQRLSFDLMKMAREVAASMAKALNITGPFNVQMLAKNHQIRVIECNLRASRSFPFVSKALGVNFIREATRLMLGESAIDRQPPGLMDLDYVVVKAPQFSFSRIKGADPKSGVEMASTGEVACFGRDTEEALLKSLIATGFKFPTKGVLLSLDSNEARFDLHNEVNALRSLGFEVFSPQNIKNTTHVKDMSALLKEGRVDLVLAIANVPGAKGNQETYQARRWGVDLGLPVISDLWVARRFVGALEKYRLNDLSVQAWFSYLSTHRGKNRSGLHQAAPRS
jgi:carbamoyl-phosphate synthase large subunit